MSMEGWEGLAVLVMGLILGGFLMLPMYWSDQELKEKYNFQCIDKIGRKVCQANNLSFNYSYYNSLKYESGTQIICKGFTRETGYSETSFRLTQQETESCLR